MNADNPTSLFIRLVQFGGAIKRRLVLKVPPGGVVGSDIIPTKDMFSTCHLFMCLAAASWLRRAA